MSNPREREPQEKEANQVTVNLGGLFVGFILFVSLDWALFVSEMTFAHLCAILLVVLAISNQIVSLKYQ